MAEMAWLRRETRRQTENTNIGLQHRECPVYSTKTQPSSASLVGRGYLCFRADNLDRLIYHGVFLMRLRFNPKE